MFSGVSHYLYQRMDSGYFLDKTCHQLLVFQNKAEIDFYYGSYSSLGRKDWSMPYQ